METEEALAAKFAVLLPHLDERQRRLYLGSEARSLGHGGIEAVARAAGVSRQTVDGRGGGAGSGRGAAGPCPAAGRRPQAAGRHRPGAAPGAARAGGPRLARRPGVAASVDDQVHPQPGRRADPAGSPVRPGHGSQAAGGGALLAAGQRQDRRGLPPPRPGRPVPVHQCASQGPPLHRPAGDQRGRQEKENVGNFKNGGREWRPRAFPSGSTSTTSRTRTWAR